MHPATTRGDDGCTMTTPAPTPPPVRLAPTTAPGSSTVPRLTRAAQGRVVGGVARGLAVHLELPVVAVRAAFVALSFSAGLGVLLYGAFWIVLPSQADRPAPRVRSVLGAVVTGAAIVVSVVLLARDRSVALGSWLVPSVLACLGGALLWRQASESERDRWRRLSRTSLQAGAFDRVGVVRVAAGIALVLAGGVVLLARSGISAVGTGLAAVAVTLGGVALITGPWWLRLAAELSSERRERIRNEERADIAARLHDSVLQTLVLIQRNAESPREVMRLARRQERELRSTLYRPETPGGRFAATVGALGAEIEDAYPIEVEAVVVGDMAMGERLEALLAATRESIVNAAKHAGVDVVSVYAELNQAEARIYVRDRGVGFDPGATRDPGHHGIQGSIVDRLERSHGRAVITSAPGSGTEVELVVELT